ncbi:hypothetical protein [Dyella silvatica]|uniref:hypothetical protein n=1 Tax=Dyella silvatica TaxID=2992128 RepID=UPI00225613D8|nr:hypothetical protein [Dyella silvatica]
MKTVLRSALFAAAVLFSITGHAADASASACQADLKQLVVPGLKTAMNKSDIAAEIAENDHGVYKVRLSVGADNPDKQVSIGWVVLDTNKNSVYDITNDDEHLEKIDVDKAKYQSFVQRCLSSKNKDAAETTANTLLPFVFDTYYQCTTGSGKDSQCNDRFHAYPISDLSSDLKVQIDTSMDTVFFLPALHDLKVILAGRTETDVNVYELYVFKGNQRVSKQLLGKMDDSSIVSFDISKNYLITTYERQGTAQSKISKVTHLKLDDSGQFISCSNANPSCK